MRDVIETGVKAIDLYAPLVRGGRLAVKGERGSGQAVLAFEIVRNVLRTRGGTAHFFVKDDPDQFRHGLREAGVEATVEPDGNGTYAEIRIGDELLAKLALGEDPEAESWVTLSRDLLKAGQLPAVDAAQSGSRVELGEHAQLAVAARNAVTKHNLAGASILAFLRQWFSVAEPWTGQPGEYWKLEDTLSGARQLLALSSANAAET